MRNWEVGRGGRQGNNNCAECLLAACEMWMYEPVCTPVGSALQLIQKPLATNDAPRGSTEEKGHRQANNEGARYLKGYEHKYWGTSLVLFVWMAQSSKICLKNVNLQELNEWVIILRAKKKPRCDTQKKSPTLMLMSPFRHKHNTSSLMLASRLQGPRAVAPPCVFFRHHHSTHSKSLSKVDW